ncbi:hypothetical protein BV898_01637 [Hypsibius exemplaris]|uniref:Folate receptor-like domain-containing protein n=1 Tax=Hypsibius exemplaris TaxID=2072580 RepID=A0A1W0XAM9_HYPEX|nr:hypothetical protein BV898_01637 [Hypsibius exemplaris]
MDSALAQTVSPLSGAVALTSMVMLLAVVTPPRGVAASGGDAVEYFDGLEETLGSSNPYEHGSSSPLAPLKVNQEFCPFFENRSPQSQPDLRNCTWYREKSCCRQAELESIFKKVKPLQGASENCMRHLNYMICWVCDPMQYNFYLNGWRRLKMCESFCDEVLDACRDAKLKGDPVGLLYKTGSEFCRSRRFDVNPDTDKSCFSYNVKKGRPGDPWRSLLSSSSRKLFLCPVVFQAIFMLSSFLWI